VGSYLQTQPKSIDPDYVKWEHVKSSEAWTPKKKFERKKNMTEMQ